MESVWEPLTKILASIDSCTKTRDLKGMAVNLRYLPSLRRELGMDGAAQIQLKLQTPSVESPPISFGTVESESFLKLLVTMILVTHKKFDEARQIVEAEIGDVRGNTGEPIIAKFYFYQALLQERTGQLDVKPFFRHYKTACLRHDIYSQATLVNIILRMLLLSNKLQQAKDFADKVEFPENAPYPEVARNQFYLGRIKALQLNYNEAFDHLTQASRKAPESLAAGFKLTVDKLRVLVELLRGEIPTRKTLVGMHGLQAYAELVRAVRSGELEFYSNVLQKHSANFVKDMNISLVERLRHIVIKSGLKRINIAYSCIHLRDVAQKLGLQPEDTEFIVAKAIRDGVIQASIDHENGILRSQVLEDKYKTMEPQQFFRKRIDFCLDLRNDAVKAMRFPQEIKKTEETTPPTDDLDIQLEDDDDF